jgi:hypothetical protein
MKKIIALLLVLASIFAFSSCKYKPVESTEEESRTVMTLSLDGKTYEVKYELYRAFFLTYKSQVDGGNADVWTSENKAEYVERINNIILDRITDIYAAFALCERIGFDIYSKDVEKEIKEYVKTSVEGGSYGSKTMQGYESYDDYLSALKSANLNYSVQTLMFRYAIAIDAIDAHYIGTASADDVNYDITLGTLTFSRDDVKAFYNSDSCAKVLRASFQKIIYYTPYETAIALRDKLVSAAASAQTPQEKDDAVLNAIIKSGYFSNAAEIENGYVIGKYNLERTYYGDMTDAVFSVAEGEVTDPISIVTDEEDTYYVIYRTYKSDEHFEANYESIKYVYLRNCVGKITYEIAEALKSSATFSDYLININHSEIGM